MNDQGISLYFKSVLHHIPPHFLSGECSQSTLQCSSTSNNYLLLFAASYLIRWKMEVMTMVPMTVGNMMMVLPIILMVIRRMTEVMTPVIMTIPDIDTIFHFDGAEDMKYYKKM